MITHQTLRERIAKSLREAIINGQIKPEERLQEVEIAAQYNTSRTPVREALRQLESEGFLVIRPRRGAVVTAITEKDVKEFYEIKSVLESYAARQAAKVISDQEINRMEALNEKLRSCYEKEDIAGMVPAHNAFHEAFVDACGNERLSQLIRQLVAQFQRFRIALSHTQAVEDSIRVHEQIIQAFRARDPERASQLVAMNSSRGGEQLLHALKSNEREVHIPA